MSATYTRHIKESFQINLSQAVLDDLKNRLANTRWTDELPGAGWNYGANKGYLKALCDYWLNSFDWREQERYLNSFPHFTSTIDDYSLHFMHVKGEGPHAIPLLLLHGYPDSFIRFLKIISLLTKADEDGFSFDLVIPSLPGYGFSQLPAQAGMNTQKIAELLARLMQEVLGYDKFAAHGGDWGSSIIEQMALHHAGLLMAIHLTEIPWRHLFTIEKDKLSETEKEYLQRGQQWQQKEGAYALIQATKPQTLSYGLNDSPVGLAAWIIEKFYNWSDCNGDLESCFTKDELLTNVTIYWATQTIHAAFRLYYESMQEMNDPQKSRPTKIPLPAGVAIFPKDMVPAPRQYADRIFNVQQWTEMPRGGHFAAWEEPQLLAADIRKFVRNNSVYLYTH